MRVKSKRAQLNYGENQGFETLPLVCPPSADRSHLPHLTFLLFHISSSSLGDKDHTSGNGTKGDQNGHDTAKVERSSTSGTARASCSTGSTTRS